MKVLYLDDHLIALEKPIDLLSVPGRGPLKQDSLATRVQKGHPSARVVHRLDLETSGVMLMALDAGAHRDLGRQFEERNTQKRYIAVVAGSVESDSGTIDQPIVKDFDHPPRHKVCHQHGRQAISHWHVLHRDAAKLFRG